MLEAALTQIDRARDDLTVRDRWVIKHHRSEEVQLVTLICTGVVSAYHVECSQWPSTKPFTATPTGALEIDDEYPAVRPAHEVRNLGVPHDEAGLVEKAQGMPRFLEIAKLKFVSERDRKQVISLNLLEDKDRQIGLLERIHHPGSECTKASRCQLPVHVYLIPHERTTIRPVRLECAEAITHL